MPKGKTLADLFVVGKEVEVSDGDITVPVWVQKLTPVDNETAVRRAGAKRAKTLSLIRMKDDEDAEVERGVYMNELFDFAEDTEAIREFLANDKLAKAFKGIEAEVASEEYWSKDNYLQGLIDEWEDGGSEKFVTNPEDKEALRVKTEIDKYAAEVDVVLVKEKESVLKDMDGVSESKLVEEAVDRLIEAKADLEWFKEFRKCRIWLGVRTPDRKGKYFDGRQSVDELSSQVVEALDEAFEQLTVGVIEGKDLEEAQTS